MTLPAPLDQLPDEATVPIGYLRKLLEEADAVMERFPNRLVTTAILSERIGMSAEWWRDRASRIPGARQESPGSPWYLPWGEARRYFESYWSERAENRSDRRGPWKKKAS